MYYRLKNQHNIEAPEGLRTGYNVWYGLAFVHIKIWASPFFEMGNIFKLRGNLKKIQFETHNTTLINNI